MDDAFGVVANRAVGFEETSTTPTSRTLVIQFDPGVNYIQVMGTKSVEPKINQAILPSSANTSESITVTNMPETPTKSEVLLTEPKQSGNDTSPKQAAQLFPSCQVLRLQVMLNILLLNLLLFLRELL